VSSVPRKLRTDRSRVVGEAAPTTDDLPLFVTFTSGSELLARLRLASITADGLRYIARNAPDWPFGDEEGKHRYVMAGSRTRTMETGVFLAYFHSGPRRGGRGRWAKPRDYR
jgi:hypothetical protein